MKKTDKRKYDVEIDGYNIRNDADFNRIDLTKPERCKRYRKKKLEKRDYYNRVVEEII